MEDKQLREWGTGSEERLVGRLIQSAVMQNKPPFSLLPQVWSWEGEAPGEYDKVHMSHKDGLDLYRRKRVIYFLQPWARLRELVLLLVSSWWPSCFKAPFATRSSHGLGRKRSPCRAWNWKPCSRGWVSDGQVLALTLLSGDSLGRELWGLAGRLAPSWGNSKQVFMQAGHQVLSSLYVKRL